MIEPRYNNLQKLFSDRVFRIPAYQRFYSWQSKQRSDLFSDLTKLTGVPSDQHHFMATIVCNRTTETVTVGTFEYIVHDVVDGQQRLTTLILLLKCLEEALPQGSMEKAELANTLVKRDGNLLLLQTNNANAHFFNAFVRDGIVLSKEQIEFKSDLNLLHAIQECRRFVNLWKNNDKLNELVRLVLHRLGFVVFDTADSRAVYTLFEVLNSRGLAVDWLDKTKSALMGKAFELSESQSAAEATIDNLQKHWGTLYRELARGDVLGEHVLQATATLYYSPLDRGRPHEKEESLDALRLACGTPHDAEKISLRLVEVARILTSLQRQPEQRVVGKILHARILYVALQLAKGVSEAERWKLVQQWERVTFRIFGLLRNDSRTRIGDYVRLGSRIIQGDSSFQTFNQIMYFIKEIGATFAIELAIEDGLLNRNIYLEQPEVCRYILWQYEEFLAELTGPGGTVDEIERAHIWNLRAEETLEHIYPQNPGVGWFGKLYPGQGATDDENSRVAHRIGNLLLLPRSINSMAGSRPFDEKKASYDKHNLRMIREVVDSDDWTLSSIEAREAKLATWATARWKDI